MGRHLGGIQPHPAGGGEKPRQQLGGHLQAQKGTALGPGPQLVGLQGSQHRHAAGVDAVLGAAAVHRKGAPDHPQQLPFPVDMGGAVGEVIEKECDAVDLGMLDDLVFVHGKHLSGNWIIFII